MQNFYISVKQHKYLAILVFFFVNLQEKSIASGAYLILVYKTNIKPSKKC